MDMEVEKIEEETEVSEPIDDSVRLTAGFVSSCKKLNVREHPDKNANILCEVVENTELMVDPVAISSGFYRVVLPSGIEGYCVKDFIAIK